MESISTPGINYIIFVMVTGALLLASVYHSVLFYYNRIRLIGDYAFYLWSVFTYCIIRCFYIQQIPRLPYFSADEVLQMLSFALYIRFTKAAMELDPEKDKLAYSFTKIAPTVIAVYLVIHAVSFGLFESYRPIDPLYFAAYIGIRAFLLLVGFICLMTVIKKRTSVYFRYIAYGVLSLIIIGMAATITELFWKNNNYVDPLTILAVGYNIDLFFFSGAISFKMRTETMEKELANKLVLEQQLEIQLRSCSVPPLSL